MLKYTQEYETNYVIIGPERGKFGYVVFCVLNRSRDNGRGIQTDAGQTFL